MCDSDTWCATLVCVTGAASCGRARQAALTFSCGSIEVNPAAPPRCRAVCLLSLVLVLVGGVAGLIKVLGWIGRVVVVFAVDQLVCVLVGNLALR